MARTSRQIEQVVQAETPVLSAADRNNPSKLRGADLRHLAWVKGLSRSSMESMTDDKIREQLRYIIHNEYAPDAVV